MRKSVHGLADQIALDIHEREKAQEEISEQS